MKFKISNQQIIRLIANSRFSPRDIIEALSSDETPEKIYNLLAHGGNIHGHMSRLGYKILEEGEDPVIFMNERSNGAPRETDEFKSGFDQKKWWNDNFPNQPINNEFEEYDELDDELEPRNYKGLRGKIVHFIPASQMKVLQGSLALIRYKI